MVSTAANPNATTPVSKDDISSTAEVEIKLSAVSICSNTSSKDPRIYFYFRGGPNDIGLDKPRKGDAMQIIESNASTIVEVLPNNDSHQGRAAWKGPVYSFPRESSIEFGRHSKKDQDMMLSITVSELVAFLPCYKTFYRNISKDASVFPELPHPPIPPGHNLPLHAVTMAWVAYESERCADIHSDLPKLRYENKDAATSPLDCWNWDIFGLYKLAHSHYRSPALKDALIAELLDGFKRRRYQDPNFPDIDTIEAIWKFNIEAQLNSSMLRRLVGSFVCYHRHRTCPDGSSWTVDNILEFLARNPDLLRVVTILEKENEFGVFHSPLWDRPDVLACRWHEHFWESAKEISLSGHRGYRCPVDEYQKT